MELSRGGGGGGGGGGETIKDLAAAAAAAQSRVFPAAAAMRTSLPTSRKDRDQSKKYFASIKRGAKLSNANGVAKSANMSARNLCAVVLWTRLASGCLTETRALTRFSCPCA